MPKLIKNNAITENEWETLDKAFDGDVPSKQVLVPLQFFVKHAQTLLESGKDFGVWLDSDEGPEELAPFVGQLKLIAVNFPVFGDGRGYSYARLLRERYDFKGELRAIGDVLHDQLFFMKRCGFDAYALREDKDPEAALAGLRDFSETYQAGCDEPKPLFRRRA